MRAFQSAMSTPRATAFSGWTCTADGCFEAFDARASDGFPLSIYRTRNTAQRPPLIVANALGSPASVLEPLARVLMDRLCVITWDVRGMPGPGLTDFTRVTPDTHATDLLDVMDRFEIPAASVAGWCTGAETTLMAAAKAPQRVLRAILLNGDYSLADARLAEHGRLTRELLREILAHPEELGAYFRMLSPHAPPSQATPDLRADDDTTLLARTSFAMRIDPEKLHRFAVMSRSFWSNRIESWIHRVEAPCTLIAAEDDVVAHVDSSRRVAALLRRASLELPRGLTHFSVGRDQTLFARVGELVCGNDPPSATWTLD